MSPRTGPTSCRGGLRAPTGEHRDRCGAVTCRCPRQTRLRRVQRLPSSRGAPRRALGRTPNSRHRHRIHGRPGTPHRPQAPTRIFRALPQPRGCRGARPAPATFMLPAGLLAGRSRQTSRPGSQLTRRHRVSHLRRKPRQRRPRRHRLPWSRRAWPYRRRKAARRHRPGRLRLPIRRWRPRLLPLPRRRRQLWLRRLPSCCGPPPRHSGAQSPRLLPRSSLTLPSGESSA